MRLPVPTGVVQAQYKLSSSIRAESKQSMLRMMWGWDFHYGLRNNKALQLEQEGI
jgi:hypothetical protein